MDLKDDGKFHNIENSKRMMECLNDASGIMRQAVKQTGTQMRKDDWLAVVRIAIALYGK